MTTEQLEQLLLGAGERVQKPAARSACGAPYAEDARQRDHAWRSNLCRRAVDAGLLAVA